MHFASDNVMGATRPVLEAILAANDGAEAAYGSDSWSARAEAMLGEVFERPVKMFLVGTGTGANALALAALTPPWGAIFCHEESHVIDDECGAPEMFTDGAKLIGIPGLAGKIDPAGLSATLARFPRGVVKAVQPAGLSISQVTEAGTLYSLDEIAALTRVARQAGIRVHLDGARFANALAGLGCTAAEMTWKAGVDVVSFGATKNGCLACEAVVFFDETLAESFQYRRKRGGHTLSKGRLLGAQLVAYLDKGHWMDNARHANAMAATLSQGLAAIPGVTLPWATQANEVFSFLPKAVDEAIREAGFRYAPWGSLSLPKDLEQGDRAFARFVTSWATKASDINGLLAKAGSAS